MTADRKKKRHINIPIFIPHLGCPNQCVFCNQKKISGHSCFDRTAVRGEIEAAVATTDADSEAEIAFFGGSFTGIDRDDMVYLLSLAKEYIDGGKVTAIRLSTRPDYIDDEILTILQKYGVTDIELGLQSLNDDVLAASKRGHTAEQARNACRLIHTYGFSLVGQMMIGLPHSTVKDECETAAEIASLCDAARIYPTVVFYDTELCDMTENGDYTPLSMTEAVWRSTAVLEIFVEKHIPVIRLGLCAADNLFLPHTIAGGAYHSAFGELCAGEYYRRLIVRELEKIGDRNGSPVADKTVSNPADSIVDNSADRAVYDGRRLTVYANPSEMSKISGQHKKNKMYLCETYRFHDVRIVGDDGIGQWNVRIGIE